MNYPVLFYNDTSIASPIYFDYYYIEFWADLYLPGVKDLYQVSTFGRVRNKFSGIILKQDKNNVNDYLLVRLYMTNGNYKHCLVHRLVAYVFLPNFLPDILNQVNHIDGVPYHNFVWNLEWCTREYNIQHAIANKLIHFGEDKPEAILTNEQVHAICKLLECNTRYDVILKTIGLEITDNNKDLISNIKRKVAWTHISCLYNIPEKNNNQKYTDDEIRHICDLLSQSKSIREISKIFDIKYNTKEYNSFYNLVLSIRNRNTFKRISKDYIW